MDMLHRRLSELRFDCILQSSLWASYTPYLGSFATPVPDISPFVRLRLPRTEQQIVPVNPRNLIQAFATICPMSDPPSLDGSRVKQLELDKRDTSLLRCKPAATIAA